MASAPDRLIVGEVRGRGVMVVACEVTAAAVEAEWRHLSGRVAAVALARALAGAGLVTGLLRPDERISLQWNVDGSLRGIVADADPQGVLRGFTHVKALPALDSGTRDYTYAMGRRGTLTATFSRAGEVVERATLDFEAGTIASELEAYVRRLRDRETAIELVAEYAGKVEYAAGLLVALEAEGGDRDFFETVRGRMVEKEAFGAIAAFREPEAFVRGFFEGDRIDVSSRRDLRFRCACSRAKAQALLRALDAREVGTILDTDRRATVACQFCGDSFEFGEVDLRALLEAIERGEARPPIPAEFGGPLGP